MSKDRPTVRIFQIEGDDRVRLVSERKRGKRSPWIWIALALLGVGFYYLTR